MNLREQINGQSPLVTSISAIVIFLMVGFVAWRVWGGSASEEKPTADVYYYDLNTLQLFTAPADSPCPLATPSGDYQGGPAGVRAHVLACGQCSDASQRYVGWLEKPQPTGDSEDVLVASAEDLKWVLASSPEGERILNKAMTGCDGKQVNLCRPEHEQAAE